MDSKRKQLAFAAALVVAAALVLWLAMRNRQPPSLPADDAHAVFASAEACLACHGPGGPHPQRENHPPSRECLRCHRHLH